MIYSISETNVCTPIRMFEKNENQQQQRQQQKWIINKKTKLALITGKKMSVCMSQYQTNAIFFFLIWCVTFQHHKCNRKQWEITYLIRRHPKYVNTCFNILGETHHHTGAWYIWGMSHLTSLAVDVQLTWRSVTMSGWLLFVLRLSFSFKLDTDWTPFKRWWTEMERKVSTSERSKRDILV